MRTIGKKQEKSLKGKETVKFFALRGTEYKEEENL